MVLTITRAGVVALAAALVKMLVLSWARPRWRSLAFPTALAGTSMAMAMLAPGEAPSWLRYVRAVKSLDRTAS